LAKRPVQEVDAGPLGQAMGEGACKQEAEQATAAVLLDGLRQDTTAPG